MRCRKVRSYLSAYCNDELTGGKKLAVDQHLAGCAECRKEQAFYQALHDATDTVPTHKVSDDFNNKLLNRIANERFAETRTKAYFPQNPPLPLWGKLVPVAVTACLLFVVGLAIYSGNSPFSMNDQYAAVGESGENDAYLYVQPTNNPYMQNNKEWSFNKQLARSERVSELSRNVIRPDGFVHNASLTSSSNRNGMPYMPDYSKKRPVIKVFVIPQKIDGKEGVGEY